MDFWKGFIKRRFAQRFCQVQKRPFRKPIAPAVGEWTLRVACRQAAEWRRQSPVFRIGVTLMAAGCRRIDHLREGDTLVVWKPGVR